MSAAIDDPVIYREPVADYQFSGIHTTYATDEERSAHTPRTTVSLFMAGLIMVGGMSGTTIGGENPFTPLATGGRTIRGELAPLPIDSARTRTTPAVEAVTPRSDREEVAWIKEHSGLTWDQLGKVFGVSRRAVHMWANGGRLNETNARRLREFSATIRHIESESPGSTPEMVRARLHQVEADGYSIVGRLQQQRSGGSSWGAPFGPERMIDATRDPLRTQVGEVGQ